MFARLKNNKKMYQKIIVTFLFLCSYNMLLQAQKNDSISQKEKVVGIVEKAKKKKTVSAPIPGMLDSLPIGIGISDYCIAIDSSRNLPGAGILSAYAAIKLPGCTEPIAFKTTAVKYNPAGVIACSQARLMLVSEERIQFGPNTILVLIPDGNNYIEWNCSGFKAVHMKGYFEFSSDVIEADSTAGGDKKIRAQFEIHTSDIHNIVTLVTINPFVIKGLKDVTFTVSDAVFDFSELASLPNMVFPPGYNFNGGTAAAWQGFYLRELRIKLPKELSGKNQPRKEIVAKNFLLDNTGVSGNVSTTNLLAMGAGDMSGWGFSIDDFGLRFLQNDLVGGNLSGKIEIPTSKTTAFNYKATIYQNPLNKQTDYTFVINPTSTVSFDVFSAKAELFPTSTITVKKVNNTFIPEAMLNGKISFDAKNVRSPYLQFQSIHLVTTDPYINGGVLDYVANNDSSTKVAGFDVSLNEIKLTIKKNTAPSVYINAGVSFTASKDQGFGAACGAEIRTKYGSPAEGRANKYEFDKVLINDISLDVNTQVFSIKGLVKYFESDPTFGTGYRGELDFKLKDLSLYLKARAVFGETTYKYYSVDAAVALPTSVPIFTGVSIKGFMGGVYYHMNRMDARPQDGLIKNGLLLQNPLNCNYIPNSNIALGLSAGVIFESTGGKAPAYGKALLTLQFNNNAGLDLIKLDADVGFMCTFDEYMKNASNGKLPVYGAASMQYDFVNSAFHMNVAANINLQKVSGTGQAVIHIDPNDWYVYVGRPSARCYVSVKDVANLSAYFMIGTKVDPFVGPPAYVGIGYSNTRNSTALASGAGFAMGASLQIGTAGQFGGDLAVFYNVLFSAGFDAMLTKYKAPARCSFNGQLPGINGWFMQGGLWAYIQVDVGLKCTALWCFGDWTAGSGFSVAAVLEAKLPNPSYVRGNVIVHYNICGYSDSFNVEAEVGQNCNVIN